MAIDKPLHLLSDSTCLRLLYYSDQTKYVSIQATSVGGLTFTPSVAAQTVAFAATAYVSAYAYKRTGITNSTAASTAMATRGVVALSATSTTNGSQHLYTITDPTSGEELIVSVLSAAASSFTFKLNSLTATFGDMPNSTDLIQASFPGVVGSHVHLVGYSTARWLVLGNTNITLSSATG